MERREEEIKKLEVEREREIDILHQITFGKDFVSYRNRNKGKRGREKKIHDWLFTVQRESCKPRKLSSSKLLHPDTT